MYNDWLQIDRYKRSACMQFYNQNAYICWGLRMPSLIGCTSGCVCLAYVTVQVVPESAKQYLHQSQKVLTKILCYC